jgi:beta-lactamase superfamily II metal-dependent hydrolase
MDFMPVGDGEKSGDAIALRFTDPDTGRHVVGVVDAGYRDDGEAIVEHVKRVYGTSDVDFVLSTHPDLDHIGGMGVVVRELKVANLLIHRPGQHGYPGNSGDTPAEELVALAQEQNANVIEPFRGVNGFGGALLIAGPTEAYYEQMLAGQETTEKRASAATGSQSWLSRAGTALLAEARTVLDAFPIELPFGDAGGTNPRNNSAAILSLMVEGEHILLPSDAGLPAITQALDYLDGEGRTVSTPRLFALPHHGSRHNIDRDTLNRVLGDPTSEHRGTVVASVSADSPKYPSPRVANAAGRRGYRVLTTAGSALWSFSADAPARTGYSLATPLPPLFEDDHDD